MKRQARQADKLVAGVYGEHAVLMQFAADLTLLLHYIACGEQRLFWFDLGLGYVWYGNKSSWYEVKVGLNHGLFSCTDYKTRVFFPADVILVARSARFRVSFPEIHHRIEVENNNNINNIEQQQQKKRRRVNLRSYKKRNNMVKLKYRRTQVNTIRGFKNNKRMCWGTLAAQLQQQQQQKITSNQIEVKALKILLQTACNEEGEQNLLSPSYPYLKSM
uniref:Uncharacterized protein n=1 Tax=Glossina palpalis gambiensis TaxID=67801 RepID=A0A1B0BFF6_9MUSC